MIKVLVYTYISCLGILDFETYLKIDFANRIMVYNSKYNFWL